MCVCVCVGVCVCVCVCARLSSVGGIREQCKKTSPLPRETALLAIPIPTSILSYQQSWEGKTEILYVLQEIREPENCDSFFSLYLFLITEKNWIQTNLT